MSSFIAERSNDLPPCVYLINQESVGVASMTSDMSNIKALINRIKCIDTFCSKRKGVLNLIPIGALLAKVKWDYS